MCVRVQRLCLNYHGTEDVVIFSLLVRQLFLGCLPEEQDKWEESAMASREAYNALRKKVQLVM